MAITVFNQNRPPQLVPVQNVVVAKDAVHQFTINATDPEGQPLTITLSNE